MHGWPFSWISTLVCFAHWIASITFKCNFCGDFIWILVILWVRSVYFWIFRYSRFFRERIFFTVLTNREYGFKLTNWFLFSISCKWPWWFCTEVMFLETFMLNSVLSFAIGSKRTINSGFCFITCVMNWLQKLGLVYRSWSCLIFLRIFKCPRFARCHWKTTFLVWELAIVAILTR